MTYRFVEKEPAKNLPSAGGELVTTQAVAGLNAAPAVAKPERKHPLPSPSLAASSHPNDTPPPEYDSDAGRPSPVGSAAATAAAVATAAATAVVAEAFSVAVIGMAAVKPVDGAEALSSSGAPTASAPPAVSDAENSGARSVVAAAAAAGGAGLATGGSPTADIDSSSERGSVATVRHGVNGGGGGGSIEGSTSVVSWHDTALARAAADPPGPAAGIVYKKRVFGPGAKVSGARDDGRKKELEEVEVGGSTSPPSVESASQSSLPAVVTMSTKGVVHGAGRPSGRDGDVGEQNADSEGREGAAGDTGDGLSSSGNLRKASRLAFSELKHDVREERLYKANAGVRALVFCVQLPRVLFGARDSL